ncbi:hypothetical protein EV385_4068 [Krasilnikovia cinnamomea]|uniref:Uncharacterized protein n=1 Tax=Krasilnikovia cinnamomea TaxID=349313 RepID=A0A4Q7ZNF5_9ACTN|nr:hypothetical protein [Krasilnikovia cinnamomea]RZU52221.1 hypothetical protein EV385_4068 [Krasilnikovia cinnamomea]
MTQPPDQEPVLDVAHGNRALSRYLLRSLEILREQSDNQDFRSLVDDVLAGRASLRDVYNTPAFAAGIDPGVRQFAERWEELSQEERDRMAEEGQAAFDAENDRIAQESST